MKAYLDENPSDEDVKDVVDGLNRYGLSQINNEEPERRSLVIKIEENVIGGAVCKAHVGQFYLDYLWVSEKHRNNGYGSMLHEKVIEIAIENKTSCVWVQTLNSKAVTFYKNIGYEEIGIVPNYVRGFDLHYLQLTF